MRRVLIAFRRLVRAFPTERRGQVALTFGLAALPMLVMTGAAIDYSRAVTVRSNLQQATDSTVLAIAHTYLTPSSTNATLSGPTQTYLTGTMNTVAPGAAGTTTATVNGTTGTVGAATLVTTTLSQNNTRMCIKTNMIIQTAMMTIAGYSNMLVGAYSCSQIGGTYEVAMVLDNSYSMTESLGSQTKMQALHQAATSLVNILIPPGTSVPTAAISLVPFNALVNVAVNGANNPPAFVDTTGASSLNWIDVAKPTWVQNPSRFTLFNSMYTSSSKTATIPWGGCVEERPNNLNNNNAPQGYPSNYMTTDVAATAGDTLFVPYFAPDDPGGPSATACPGYGSYGITCNYNSYNDYNSYTTTTGPHSPSGDSTKWSFMNGYLADNGYRNASTAPTAMCTSANWAADNSSLIQPGAGVTLSCKYNGAVPTIGTEWFGLSIGPNENCSTPPITPLTTNNTTLVNAIAAMEPTGLTNLGTGFMWGWRTISPVVNPFPAGNNPPLIGQQNPKTYGYGPPPNKKVIILMTDGYDTWSPIIFTSSQGAYGEISNNYQSAYEDYGYMTDNRLANYSGTTCPQSGSTQVAAGNGTAVTSYQTFRCQMDNMLLEGCNNFKAADPNNNIIYSVALSISSDPIDQEGRTVLQDCASSSSNYFEASTGSGIVSVFQQIAASITNLRISQ